MKTNNKKMNVKMFAWALVLGLGACSDAVDTLPVPGPAPLVKTRLAAFEGTGQALEGENEVKDLRACLFESGVLTKVYDAPMPVDGGYGIQLDSHAGTLYVVANTGGLLDLDALKERSISESEWLRLTVAMQGAAPAHFFSGSVKLDGMENSQTELPVTLKRGLVRFDLQIRTAGVASVRSLTLKNAAQSAYLFPVPGDLSPADVQRRDAVATISEPLTKDTPAVLYLYEQENGGLEAVIEAEIDGVSKTLTKRLETDLERNRIYTLTVRKDVIDVHLDVSFDEWEEGSDTELTPLRR